MRKAEIRQNSALPGGLVGLVAKKCRATIVNCSPVTGFGKGAETF